MQKGIDDIYLVVILGMAGTFLLSAAIVFFYIRYHKKFTLQREEMQRTELAYQVKLLYATFQSQENERKRIGRDMHDDVCGSLSNLRLIVSKCEAGLVDSPSILNIKKSQQIIDELIAKVRNISHDLSPSGLEIFGFADTLENLCDTIRNSTEIKITIENNAAGALKKVNIDTSLAIYRVMQELLNNTLKHAEARNIDISILHEKDALQIDYKDDGKGFDLDKFKNKGIGLHNIKSRLEMVKGSFDIKTTPGSGFELNILLPVV
jgi:signal transduction histidine kinase